MAEGRLLISSENASTGAAKRVWFNVLDIVDGVKVSESHRNKVFDNAYFDYAALGHYRLNISPLGSKYFMIDGTGNVAATANMDNIPEDYALMSEELLDKLSNNHGYFRYSGHSYMVAPDNTAEGNGGVLLFDITDGLDNATLVPTQNSSLAIAENTSADGVAAAGATLAKVDDFGEVVSANMASSSYAATRSPASLPKACASPSPAANMPTESPLLKTATSTQYPSTAPATLPQQQSCSPKPTMPKKHS